MHELTADDVRKAMEKLYATPYQAHVHIVHPRFRGYRFATSDELGRAELTRCASCGIELYLVKEVVVEPRVSNIRPVEGRDDYPPSATDSDYVDDDSDSGCGVLEPHGPHTFTEDESADGLHVRLTIFCDGVPE